MDLSAIKPPARRSNFVGSGNSTDHARGLQFFEAQEQIAPELVRTGTALRPETDRCGLYIVLMPAIPVIADFLERLGRESCTCRTIVDVHADFWTPGFEPEGSLEWWRQDGHVDTLERCMRAADVVTVPNSGYLTVERFNPNVVIVPDATDHSDQENVMDVGRGWVEAISIASRYTR